MLWKKKRCMICLLFIQVLYFNWYEQYYQLFYDKHTLQCLLPPLLCLKNRNYKKIGIIIEVSFSFPFFFFFSLKDLVYLVR